MNNLKTMDEFINEEFFFRKKKELTPDEEYRRQAEKERKRVKDMMKQGSKVSRINPDDPYGEEEWDPKKDVKQQRAANISNKKSSHAKTR